MTIVQLTAEIAKIRMDITKSRLGIISNPPKDTNLIPKKKKKLARLLTNLNKIMQEEKLVGITKK